MILHVNATCLCKRNFILSRVPSTPGAYNIILRGPYLFLDAGPYVVCDCHERIDINWVSLQVYYQQVTVT